MRNIDKYKLYPGKMSVLPEGWEIFKTYNLRQAAAMLGVCDKTLKKLAENGQIQCRRVGKGWIFCDRALREWLCSDDGKKNAWQTINFGLN